MHSPANPIHAPKTVPRARVGKKEKAAVAKVGKEAAVGRAGAVGAIEAGKAVLMASAHHELLSFLSVVVRVLL